MVYRVPDTLDVSGNSSPATAPKTTSSQDFGNSKTPTSSGLPNVPLDRSQDPRHVFYCVLALAVAHLMRRQAHLAGLNLSVRELLTTLGGIQETVLLYPTGNKGRPGAQRIRRRSARRNDHR